MHAARPHSSRPIRSVLKDVRQLHRVEHVGESEWTPLIAIVGLFLFLLSVELLTFGIVEGAFRLLASAA